MDRVKESEVSLAIIDIMMPELNGFQVIKEIRKEYNIPVIILSARDDFSDKILGLDIGADDYMTKPFNPLELLARIQAQLRRFNELNRATPAGTENKPKTIELGNLTLDPVSCTLSKEGEVLALTST